jgi:hypothetical protein
MKMHATTAMGPLFILPTHNHSVAKRERNV